MSKYFFLSYARLDRDEDKFECVSKFYDDLVEEVRSQTALLKEGICFFDGKDIEPGYDWPDTLSKALGTSRLFVCLYSRTFFTREHCGKEWQIFYSRLRQYVSNSSPGTQIPPLIFPVLLGAPQELPPLPDYISRIQYQHADFPDVYNQEGLRYMIKLGLDRDYRLLIIKLARKLIHTAEIYKLKPLDPFPDIQTVKSIFDEQDSQQLNNAQVHEEADPRRVHFFFVAGKRQELAGTRKALDCYGNEGGPDWKPYLPVCSEEIALIAQGVAYNEKLISEIVPLDENVIQKLKDAKQSKRIVAIIVDSWTILLSKYADWMREYDEYDSYNCAMLIPHNIEDEETRDSLKMLDQSIRSVFETKASRKGFDFFLYPIESHDKLREKLGFVLGKIRMDILSKKVGAHEVTTETAMTMPIIAGPGEI